MDRIDLQIEVPAVKYRSLESCEQAESSEDIRERVNKARKIQLKRYKGYNIYSNSQMESAHINEFCRLGDRERNLLKQAFEKLGLSARAYGRILKVARTIADLDESSEIHSHHLAEAIQYRSLDRKLWR